jgi:hypothetical protein
MSTDDYSRREFLRLSCTLAAGIALPPVLYGCMGNEDDAPPIPAETFVEPQILSSVGGRLDVTMKR